MANTGASVGSGTTRLLIERPALFDLLNTAQRVVQISAPAGSGKTFLVRSWTTAQGLGDRVAWVSVGRQERDPQAFWLSVVDSLRRTRPGSDLVRALTAAPELDGATVAHRLREDLSSLQQPLWLVIDDLHELRSEEAIEQMGVLLAGAPPQLRFLLLTRRDLRLGLHRLRLEGELTEIRREDLRFSVDESRTLLEAAGVRLSDAALESLVATTEGWAAGLRLAALSMASDPDPERFAARFSGSDRAVAEYLLAEVLERQPPDVSRLLLRTSLLRRVSGPLADRLTQNTGSHRILAELEDAGAFVVAVDPERTWFRYHHLFADLLALELRRTAPQEVAGLHTSAAEWLAEHGYAVSAIRHAQAAENWDLAARLLADNWRSMRVAGRMATASELLWAFPADRIAADAELAAIAADDRRAGGSLDEAERYLVLAEQMSESVPVQRRRGLRVALVLVRLALALTRNDLDAVAEQARRALALADDPRAIEPGVGDEGLRATALIELGMAQLWAGELQAAERQLERGLEEARRIGQPLLELHALSHAALLNLIRSPTVGTREARQAIELARAHGWEQTSPAAATAYVALGSSYVWRGQLREAQTCLEHAELVLARVAQPTTAMMMHVNRALLEFALGRHEQAMTAQRAAAEVGRGLTTRHVVATRAQARALEIQVHLGETEVARRALEEMDESVRATGEMRVVQATLLLTEDDPEGAAAILAPIFTDDPIDNVRWEIQALLLTASAQQELGDIGASSRALERALDLAEPEGLLLPFLFHPTPDLLERHARLRTTHAALIADILNLLSGRVPVTGSEDAEPLQEPLSESELRVLRYLPTNLRAPEIAAELFVSPNTTRTHLRKLYAKLGVHTRADAVKRARQLGLLSPSSLGR